MTEEKTTLQLTLAQDTDRTYQVTVISAGVGNGWTFPPNALRASLALWHNIECFIDHDLKHRSIKDLAGMITDPEWDETNQAINATLTPFGPAANLLHELAQKILADQTANSPKPRVGFSADIFFIPEDKTISRITKVNSVDLVFNPARGGKFIRALNSEQGVIEMQEETNTTQAAPPAQDPNAALRIQLSAYLLDSALAASHLPQPVQTRIRAQFTGREFQPDDLKAAIADARALITELTASQVVTGPGRISGMFSTEDQLQCAVDDLMGAPRDQDKASQKVHNLTGIRELYLLLTGDYDLHGGYQPDRVQLAATVDFTGLVKNALNKVVVNTWESLGKAGYDWWNRITTIEHFNTINDITGTLVGTVGNLPVVAEGAEYTELPIGDSPETASFVKYGGYIPLTLELIDRDETRKLKAYPRELASAGLRKISQLIAAIFTANAGVGPSLADGGALFNSTVVTTTGGHANLTTTALAPAQWEIVSTAVYNQPMLIKNAPGMTGTGPKMAVNPKYLLVPRALQLVAMKILYPTIENAANIFSENQQRGQPGDVITVPEWTDVTDWAAVIDPRIVPGIYIGERFGLMPEIFIAGDNLSPAVFTNDEHRLKVRHFLAVWVNDFRPLHKANVAG